jgi:hypothetical protein
MTLEMVGSRVGLTRERVRQIEHFAIASLRELMGVPAGRKAGVRTSARRSQSARGLRD